ncbi:Protein T16G12.1, partial [Aphelenchoides avenae]
ARLGPAGDAALPGVRRRYHLKVSNRYGGLHGHHVQPRQNRPRRSSLSGQSDGELGPDHLTLRLRRPRPK